MEGIKQYLIKWEGYNEEENTWEPMEHLTHCQKMVKEFENSRQEDPRKQADSSPETSDWETVEPPVQILILQEWQPPLTSPALQLTTTPYQTTSAPHPQGDEEPCGYEPSSSQEQPLLGLQQGVAGGAALSQDQACALAIKSVTNKDGTPKEVLNRTGPLQQKINDKYRRLGYKTERNLAILKCEQCDALIIKENHKHNTPECKDCKTLREHQVYENFHCEDCTEYMERPMKRSRIRQRKILKCEACIDNRIQRYQQEIANSQSSSETTRSHLRALLMHSAQRPDAISTRHSTPADLQREQGDGMTRPLEARADNRARRDEADGTTLGILGKRKNRHDEQYIGEGSLIYSAASEEFSGREPEEGGNSVTNSQWTPMTAAEYIRTVAAQAQEDINNTVIMMEGMLLAKTDPETGEWEASQWEGEHHDR
jgi:hypothetical protein